MLGAGCDPSGNVVFGVFADSSRSVRPIFLNAPPDEDGFVAVDPETLHHTEYDNVYALGENSNLPTAKTGAAICRQSPVLVDQLTASITGSTPRNGRYDGYSSCLLVTGYGRLVLAEFDYDKEPRESFPVDQTEERGNMYALKAYGLLRMHWNGMLKGRMWAAGGPPGQDSSLLRFSVEHGLEVAEGHAVLARIAVVRGPGQFQFVGDLVASVVAPLKIDGLIALGE